MHTTDQIVGQAARLGFTVGITVADLVGPQCSAVIGLSAFFPHAARPNASGSSAAANSGAKRIGFIGGALLSSKGKGVSAGALQPAA